MYWTPERNDTGILGWTGSAHHLMGRRRDANGSWHEKRGAARAAARAEKVLSKRTEIRRYMHMASVAIATKHVSEDPEEPMSPPMEEPSEEPIDEHTVEPVVNPIVDPEPTFFGPQSNRAPTRADQNTF